MIPASAPTAPTSVELSVIVPVYNEAASLPVLYERLKAVLESLELSWARKRHMRERGDDQKNGG